MIRYGRIRIPVFHLFICRLMQERAHNHPFISHDNVKEIFSRRLYFLPVKYRVLLLREMEELKLLKKVGGKNNLRYEFLVKNAESLLRQYYDPIF